MSTFYFIILYEILFLPYMNKYDTVNNIRISFSSYILVYRTFSKLPNKISCSHSALWIYNDLLLEYQGLGVEVGNQFWYFSTPKAWHEKQLLMIVHYSFSRQIPLIHTDTNLMVVRSPVGVAGLIALQTFTYFRLRQR